MLGLQRNTRRIYRISKEPECPKEKSRCCSRRSAHRSKPEHSMGEEIGDHPPCAVPSIQRQADRRTNKGQSCNCKSVTCLLGDCLCRRGKNLLMSSRGSEEQMINCTEMNHAVFERPPSRSVLVKWRETMMEHVVNTIHPSVHHQIMTFQSIPLNSIQRRNVNRLGQSRRINNQKCLWIIPIEQLLWDVMSLLSPSPCSSGWSWKHSIVPKRSRERSTNNGSTLDHSRFVCRWRCAWSLQRKPPSINFIAVDCWSDLEDQISIYLCGQG